MTDRFSRIEVSRNGASHFLRLGGYHDDEASRAPVRSAILETASAGTVDPPRDGVALWTSGELVAVARAADAPHRLDVGGTLVEAVEENPRAPSGGPMADRTVLVAGALLTSASQIEMTARNDPAEAAGPSGPSGTHRVTVAADNTLTLDAHDAVELNSGYKASISQSTAKIFFTAGSTTLHFGIANKLDMSIDWKFEIGITTGMDVLGRYRLRLFDNKIALSETPLQVIHSETFSSEAKLETVKQMMKAFFFGVVGVENTEKAVATEDKIVDEYAKAAITRLTAAEVRSRAGTIGTETVSNQ